MRHLDICVCCSNKPKQTIAPQVGNHDNDHAGEKRAKNRSPYAPVNVFRFPPSQRNAQCGGGSITKKQAQSPAHNRNRENNASGSVTQIANAVADENLVNDVVKARNNQGTDTGGTL
jgi:hypothetical protein